MGNGRAERSTLFIDRAVKVFPNVQGCRHSELVLVRVYVQVSKCARAQKGPFSLLSMAGKCAQNKTHQERRNVNNFEGPVIRESPLIGFQFVTDRAYFRKARWPMGSDASAVISQPNPSVHLSVHPFLSACIEGNFYILT